MTRRPSPTSLDLTRAAIAVTRPAERSAELTAVLTAAGARVDNFPVTRIETHVDPARIERELERLAGQWLILPSPTAVETFLAAAREIPNAHALLGRIRLATIGLASINLLKAAGLCAFMPPEPNGASLAQSLPARPGDRVLIAGSELSRAEVGDGLAARGIEVDRLPLYKPVPDGDQLDRLRGWLAAPFDPLRPARIVIVASPSAASAIAKSIGGDLWHTALWLAIGPTTLAEIKKVAPVATCATRAELPEPAALARAAAALAEAQP